MGFCKGPLSSAQYGSQPVASFNTGPGELAAPISIGASSPNAIIGLGGFNATLNQICCVLQQICYQADPIQNSSSRFASEMFPVPFASNPANCTEVLVNNLSATEIADSTANKLAGNSTSVELQGSVIPAIKSNPKEEIASTPNQKKSQTEDDSQLSTSCQQNSPVRPSHPNSNPHFSSHISLLLRSQYPSVGTPKAHKK
ncbi:hypothetical protein DSO57_1009700 [Entomophthora muscae]|uniref:Uncharacterized protein n=1 Tax=Entomophthora muscae TaxID=34485 RepID=A0ACC2THP9_9FUNG|nr:hypothetical protein DSO57_1009700 [Entomophthora muscae]